ncbi:MAG: hydrogenase formation protein HypD [Clostridium sp.]|uniref:hydrogenase formation protein HypD n=1 Tax=Clostridium sp. TaxID=1506 RepID=UPI00302DFF62
MMYKEIIDSQHIELSKKLLNSIELSCKSKINIMEVCGTHARSIYSCGIDKLLPSNIKILSGPGCPVCVTPQSYIDDAISLSRMKDVIVATFGDMIKIPGSRTSLREEKAIGNDIRIVYSPLEALKIAKNNCDKEVVFLAVGFETTAPLIALTIKEARRNGINNFSVLHALKTMPNTMTALVLDESINIDGFICPGHVATIIGNEVFDKLSKQYKIPMAVCGFKGVDILAGILSIIVMEEKKEYECKNLYKGFVKDKGNDRAKRILGEVFIPGDSVWRGLGRLMNTGYTLKAEYRDFDAKVKFHIESRNERENEECICGDVLKGIKSPKECKLFGKPCKPGNPVGPCMVSEEGTCGIVYSFES